jgi:hypothetical protein
VTAGIDPGFVLPAVGNLAATASDDGLPPPGTVSVTWSRVSGPGAVTFGNASSVATTATFPQTGIYVLRLTASDGTLTAFDELTVSVATTTAGEAVIWTSLVGVTATGNDLNKTGTLVGWNAGAASTRAIASGGGFVEFIASEKTTQRMLGLSNGDANVTSGDIDFAFSLEPNGVLSVYEGGVKRATNTYATGNTLRVAIESGAVTYRKNGTLLYTSTVAPTYPLLVDTSLFTAAATLNDAVLSGTLVTANSVVEDVVWTNLVGVTAAGNDLTKTAAAGWNAGAASTRGISAGEGYVEFAASETTKGRMLGLSNADANPTTADISYALYLKSNGTLSVYESGVERSLVGSYATGDTLRVAVEAGVVKYRRNGTLLYTSVAPTYPLIVDTALDTTGATLNDAVLSGNLITVTFVGEAVVWTNLVGVTAAANDLTKTAATGWNAGAASTRAVGSGGGFVEFTASETNKGRMLGLSNGDSGVAITDIDFALHLESGAVLSVYESGVKVAVVGTYATNDTLRVSVESGRVKYRKNGTLLYMSAVAPTYPLRVDTSLNTSAATLKKADLYGNVVVAQ